MNKLTNITLGAVIASFAAVSGASATTIITDYNEALRNSFFLTI